MAAQFTLKEILERAIQKEIESQRLYSDLSQKMTNDAAKDALRRLSQQEQEHQDLLEQYQGGELKDVFLLAANREMHSHELYLALAGLHPPGDAKRLLEELASQELEHKQKVEFLYTEVAFPQTDGG
jgi:rubrerythrin